MSTVDPNPIRTMQQALERSFARNAGLTAVECGERRLTFAELDGLSARIAAGLAGRGIPRHTPVGLLCDDRLALIAAMVGVLRADLVFVPLDPAYPPARLQGMVETAALEHIVHTAACAQAAAALVPHTYDYAACGAGEGAGSVAVVEDGDSPIYIYFTSGTTGRPKAILGRNKGLLHFVEWEAGQFQTAGLRFSQFIVPAFDPFLRDVFVPLCSGGTICIPERREILLDPAALTAWVQERTIGLIHCVPSLFRQLLDGVGETITFPHLRFILLAGEKANPADLRRWYARFSERVQLVNLYGPSETTLAKLFHLITPADAERPRIPVGKAIRGARAIILDEHLQPCDDMVKGEIYIRTPYRSLGYYRDPEATAARFLPNPFSGDAGDLIYRTGDLGQRLPDGSIDILGRVDRQIKIRGMRLEAEEIERALCEFPGVREAAVIKVESAAGGELLAAFYAGDESAVDGEALRAWLAGRLPDYMVPAWYGALAQLPRKPNGKIDFDQLPELQRRNSRAFVPPRSETEIRLADLWAAVLHVEKVGLHDHFFELGGNSLNVMTLIARIQREFSVTVPMADIFHQPTLEKQAALVDGLDRGRLQPVEVAPVKEDYELAPAQQRIYVLQQLQPGSTAYNIPIVLRVCGPVDRDRVDAAFAALVRRHDALRTSFHLVAGRPRQRVHETVDFGVEHRRLEPGVDAEAEARECIRPFDPARAPLLRVSLLETAPAEYILVADTHHLVSDAASQALLIRDFVLLYLGQQPPPLLLQYKDYAEWLNGRRRAGELQRQQEFWLRELSPLPPRLRLPLDAVRDDTIERPAASVHGDLPDDVTARLQEIAAAADTTLFQVHLALCAVFLHKISGQEDLVVGTPIAGRNHPDLRGIIGVFINTLPLRLLPRGERRFFDFVEEVRERCLQAFAHQEYPFEELADRLSNGREGGRQPVFDVLFTFDAVSRGLERWSDTGDIRLEPVAFHRPQAKFDLTVSGTMAMGRCRYVMEYNRAVFQAESMERFMGYYREIASAAALDRFVRLQDIRLSHELRTVTSDAYRSRESDFEF